LLTSVGDAAERCPCARRRGPRGRRMRKSPAPQCPWHAIDL